MAMGWVQGQEQGYGAANPRMGTHDTWHFMCVGLVPEFSKAPSAYKFAVL